MAHNNNLHWIKAILRGSHMNYIWNMIISFVCLSANRCKCPQCHPGDQQGHIESFVCMCGDAMVHLDVKSPVVTSICDTECRTRARARCYRTTMRNELISWEKYEHNRANILLFGCTLWPVAVTANGGTHKACMLWHTVEINSAPKGEHVTVRAVWIKLFR